MKYRSLFVVLLALLLAPDQGRASSFYYELGAGLSRIRSAAPFFSSAPATTSGYALNFTLAYNFSRGSVPIDAQFGLQYRAVTGADRATEYYAIQAPYLLARVQLSRLYFGAGVAPLVWRRVNPSPGLDSFSRATGSLAYMGEAGFLWPVAPIFSLGATGSAQYVTTSGTLSPRPTLELTVLMRAYFGFHKASSSDQGSSFSNEFKGWRYPFGNEMK